MKKKKKQNGNFRLKNIIETQTNFEIRFDIDVNLIQIGIMSNYCFSMRMNASKHHGVCTCKIFLINFFQLILWLKVHRNEKKKIRILSFDHANENGINKATNCLML